MNSEHLADLAALDAWIKKVSAAGAVPILCGENGDMDTVGSAIALAAAIPNGMACGLHRDKVAKRVAENLDAPWMNGRVGVVTVFGVVHVAERCRTGDRGEARGAVAVPVVVDVPGSGVCRSVFVDIPVAVIVQVVAELGRIGMDS